jgi:anhydro-N-acetylmuramic acid kinase
MLVMGLMSGTSADGIDVAVARVEGTPPGLKSELMAHATIPMNPRVRKEVLRIAEGGACTAGQISQLNFRLGEEFAGAAIAACKRFEVAPNRIELIGSHGQTIFHQGQAVDFLGEKTASTLQLGEGAVIAARTGLPTVSDFRAADVAAGGQGAPLVPYVDWLWYKDAKMSRVSLNLGGIGNITVIPAGNGSDGSQVTVKGAMYRGGEEKERPSTGDQKHVKEYPRTQTRVSVLQGTRGVTAFDTGPGNMVIDALVAHFTQGRKRFDEDARMARTGRSFPALLEEFQDDPYLKRPPPKSTGREYYGREYVKKVLVWGKKHKAQPEDLVRAATIFTALSVVDALSRFVLPKSRIDQLIVSGGGAHNPLIMAQLEAALAPINVVPSSRLGVPEDAKEAYAFAVLAYETWHRRAGNLPSATGARRGAVLGKISWAGTEQIADSSKRRSGRRATTNPNAGRRGRGSGETGE